jgi:hypothetical protein
MEPNPAFYTSYKNSVHKDPEQYLKWFRHEKGGFISFLPPEFMLEMDDTLLEEELQKKFGTSYQDAIGGKVPIPSPLHQHQNTDWLKRVNMVGINIRTIGGYWEVVKYAITLPKSQSAIHLLPIWEPGVVSSLYGMASWHLNPEFFSEAWYQLQPQLDSVEKQLKACINVLHLLGKTVGLDVIPHTDRYSEIVLANPSYFEWLWRKGETIADHRADLHLEVEKAIHNFLMGKGPAVPHLGFPPPVEIFFSKTSEASRMRWLFGEIEDYGGRQQRRIELVDYLYKLGFEPVPATMGPPYRGLRVSTDPAARTVDKAGRIWYDYEITEPQEFSRVFGPLTRYKLYERLEDNQNWAIDFSRPRQEVWSYVAARFREICTSYPFDFMRGDMSHVQMRPEGVPDNPDSWYDIHQYIKKEIQEIRPWFGYFAESFLAPDDTMSYGSEADHLEASDADSTLGDLQSMVVGSPEFLTHFDRYLRLAEERNFAPNFTVMTADKDDPRFDKFYLHGNEARLFIALFLPCLPSYMGLGFETRDFHPEPAPNEHYTKLYVFQIEEGPKATQGPYVWGRNIDLFLRLNDIRRESHFKWDRLQENEMSWIKRPDPEDEIPWIAWEIPGEYPLVFVVNLDPVKPVLKQKLGRPGLKKGEVLLSTHTMHVYEINVGSSDEYLPEIQPGEGLIIQYQTV